MKAGQRLAPQQTPWHEEARAAPVHSVATAAVAWGCRCQCSLLILCLMSHSGRMSKPSTGSGRSLLEAHGALSAVLHITELPLQGC